MTTSPPGQVGALLALRWAMVRTPGARLALIVVALIAGALLVASASTSLAAGVLEQVDPELAAERALAVTALLPTAMLAFSVMAVVAPLAAGGAYELIPTDHLVAYPLRPATLVRLSALLTPLNLAWFVQLLLLVFSSSFGVRGPYAPWLPLLIVLSFAAAATLGGQAIAWVVVGIRRTPRGRATVWGLGVAMVVAVVWITWTDRGTEVLDALPGRKILGAMLIGASSGLTPTVVAWLLGLLVLVPISLALGTRAAAWALRRPDDRGGDLSGRPVTRRPWSSRESTHATYSLLLAIDRASVWRSAPLRRGILVLAALPGGVAALAGLPWETVALMPPLVASGAGLLFGVNTFSLDGSGSLWIASTPHDHRMVLRAKARVVMEVGLVAVSIAVVGGLLGGVLRGRGIPGWLDLAIVVGCAVSCVALVAALCVRLSVTRPHRADLRGARDTPAPPGVMALYSTVFAFVTTPVGLLFSGATVLESPTIAALTTGAVLTFALASWLGTTRRWDDTHVRAGVVATVAAG